MYEAISSLFTEIGNAYLDKKVEALNQEYGNLGKLDGLKQKATNAYHKGSAFVYGALSNTFGNMQDYSERTSLQHKNRIQKPHNPSLEETIERLSNGNFAEQARAERLRMLQNFPKPQSIWGVVKKWWKQYRINRWEKKLEKQYGEGFYFIPEDRPC